MWKGMWGFPTSRWRLPESEGWELVWAEYANQDSSRRINKHGIIIYIYIHGRFPISMSMYWRATNVGGILKSFRTNWEGFELGGFRSWGSIPFEWNTRNLCREHSKCVCQIDAFDMNLRFSWNIYVLSRGELFFLLVDGALFSKKWRNTMLSCPKLL